MHLGRQQVIPCHTKLITCNGSSFATNGLPSAWATKRLKNFLKEKGIPVSSLKRELIVKANDFIKTEAL